MASPVAAAVSRPIGSATMFPGGTSVHACRQPSSCAWVVRTKIFSLGTTPTTRSTVWASMVFSPTMGSRCFGRAIRLCGQKRSPRPPAIITTKRSEIAPRFSGRPGGSTVNCLSRRPMAIGLLFAPLRQPLPALMETPLEVDVITAAQLVRDGAVLLDVREPVELAICRVAGSREIPMRQIPEQLDELPRDTLLLVLCHHGHRSMRV